MNNALCWLTNDWWGSLSTFLPRKPLPHLAGWKASRLSSGDRSGSPGEDGMFPPGFSCSVSGAHPCPCRCPGTQASMLPVVGRSFLVLPYFPDRNLRGHFRWMAAFPSGLEASPCSLCLSPVFLMVNSSQLMPLLVKSHSSLQDANLIFFSFALKIAQWLLWLWSPSDFPWGDRLHAAHLCTHPRDMFPALWPSSCSFSQWRPSSRTFTGDRTASLQTEGVGAEDGCEFPPGASDSLPLLPGQQMGLATLSCSRLAAVRCPHTSSMHLLQCKPLEGRVKLHSTVCPVPTQSWAHYW